MGNRATEVTEDTIDAINLELYLASKKHKDYFNSPHEGYAVIKEELEELWDDIKKDKSKEAMRIEAIQVAAMAVRFIQELT